MQGTKSSRWWPRAACVAVLLALGLEGGRGAEAKPPGEPAAMRAVEAAMEADERDLPRALEALGPYDAVTWAEVPAWRKALLAMAAKGRKAPTEARSFLYEKPERGLYLLGGKRGGKGGLVIALHGGGAGAGDAGQAASAFGGAASSLGLWMAAPEVLEKTERGWTDPPETERFVLDLIEGLKRAGRVDPNRIYLTGHSMGGYGTWTIGAVHADVFAGLAAFAGAPTCTREKAGGPPTGVQDGILPNLRNLPIFVYQSLDDRNVPAESNECAVPLLAALAKEDPGGYVHTYERVDGRGHGFPEKGPEPGMAWAMAKPRDPRPKKVVWQPSRPWKRHFYWLWWEQPDLGSTVTAEVAGPNAFAVTASGALDGLLLLVDERSIDPAKEVVVTVAGKETFRRALTPSLRTLVRTARRNDDGLCFAAAVPVVPEAR